MVRYSLLPYWYTVFYWGYASGLPVMRTMFSEFPDDTRTFSLEDQWMVGGSLLVAPVITPGHTSVNAYLPPSALWYDLHSLVLISSGVDGSVTLPAPMTDIPVLVRGGSILPRKMRLRRSSKLMFHDPYTLVVAPDAAGHAEGALYMDDEISLAHETKERFCLRT